MCAMTASWITPRGRPPDGWPQIHHDVSGLRGMNITHSLSSWPQTAHGSVMALGNFDGMHRGHQAVIAEARKLAEAQGRPLSIMTFEPHPRRFFVPDSPVLRIVPFSDKARLLREAGVEYLYVARFNRDFSQLPAEAFIRDVLLQGLRVAHVVTGHNFAFGYKRGGDVAYLREQAGKIGFGYTEVGAVAPRGGELVYSSTAVREALARGAVDEAADLLGRAYTMRGRVIHGDKRGRSIGFPTANIRPAPLFLPRYGVYAVRLHVGGEVYDSVANLGMRPTVDGSRRLLEVHMLDANKDIYGLPVQAEFIGFIRPEMKFSGLEALTAQIAQDLLAAKAMHQQQQKVSL